MDRFDYFTDLSFEEIQETCVHAGGRPFHGKALYHWIFKRGALDLAAMTDLPKRLRAALETSHRVHRLKAIERAQGRDGTVKILYQLPDQETVETVEIPERERFTLCISTQVGCAMGCRFCASGITGLERNLTAGEIVEQVLHSILLGNRPVTNLVIMGIGEPLMNLENLSKALITINRRDGIGFGARRITVSTVGIPKGIRKLAELGLQIKLAVSLHAAIEEKRRALMPIGSRVSIRELMEAADYYRQKTTRDVTFEVLLLGGVNDGPEDAEALITLLEGRKTYVNLIPYNPVGPLPFRPPGAERISAFRKALEGAGIPVTVRKSRGIDIDAACGQLRLKRENRKGPSK